MFTFEVEGQEFGMKPMNCPGHCVMFKYDLKSYRDLPIRMADFGVLHRNELSGALTGTHRSLCWSVFLSVKCLMSAFYVILGLTRVRRFQQDDAHIFCRQDQIKQEVGGVLDMLRFCYGVFGYTFELQLPTRPEKFLGELEVWDEAELALASCLDEFGVAWTLNVGDGAFYGPKIDIQRLDALQRKHQ